MNFSNYDIQKLQNKYFPLMYLSIFDVILNQLKENVYFLENKIFSMSKKTKHVGNNKMSTFSPLWTLPPPSTVCCLYVIRPLSMPFVDARPVNRLLTLIYSIFFNKKMVCFTVRKWFNNKTFYLIWFNGSHEGYVY